MLLAVNCDAVFNFIYNNLSNIISLFVSMGALLISIISYIRGNKIRNQNEQEHIYSDIRKLIESRNDFYSSEKRIIGDTTHCGITSIDEEEIKRKTNRFFGRREYQLLCKLLRKMKRAKEIDSDIGMLFELIRQSDEDTYSKLQDILTDEYTNDFDEVTCKKNEAFLKTITIPYYEAIPNENGKRYDYLELIREREDIIKEIVAIQEKLEDRLLKAMMKR